MVKRVSLLVLAGTLAVVFHRLLTGEVFFWGLPALQFVPWRQLAFDMLRDGYLPLWNLYNGAGAPLFANYQSALLYPFNWPGFVLPLAWQMSVTAVLHLFIAGWGMWAFTGRLEVPALGRGLSALAFGLSAYLAARLGTYPIISAAAWMPWLLWAALGVLTRSRRRDLAWLALFAGMQLLAGHAQTAWYSLLLVGAFAAWFTFTRRPANWRRLVLVGGALLLGAGIAALQLLATGELLLQSQRSNGVGYDFAMNFSYDWKRALNLLSPNVFGSPGSGTYITEGAFFEDAVYIGLIPLVSALAVALAWVWRRLRRMERPAYWETLPFWLLVVIVGFVMALGKNSPVFPFLYEHVPTFDLFQAPVRWHIWTIFGLSLLAGMGVGAWGRGKWLLFGTRLATAACLGAVALALFAPRFLPPEVAVNEGVRVIIQAVIFTGIMGALAGDLTLVQPEPGSRLYRWWSAAVLLVVAFDLGYAAQGLNPTIPAAFYDRLEADNTASARAYWPEKTQETAMYERYLPFRDYRVAVENRRAFRASGLPNLNLLEGQPLLNNFDPLLVGHFAEYLDQIEANPAQAGTLLLAAGTGWIVDAEGSRAPIVPEQPPGAVFMDAACWHPGNSSLKAGLLAADWQPLRQVHLLGVGDCPPVSDESPAQAVVTSVAETPNQIIIEVQTETGGLLYIPNTDYPGWQAFVDGQSARILRANLAFMAVEVPAGANEVRLEYHPWWLLPGTLASLFSLIVTLVLFRSKNPGQEG